jgi:hypothetical protein
MASILDSIQQQVESTAVQQVSQRLGIDPTLARQAVDVAVPAIMGKLANRAATPDGASRIHREATAQAAGPQHTNPLPQVLGDQHADVEQKVRDATGLNRDDAAKILGSIGPAVMRGIGDHVRKEGINPTQLGSVLGTADREMR